jgi:arsenical pump membrane protein
MLPTPCPGTVLPVSAASSIALLVWHRHDDRPTRGLPVWAGPTVAAVVGVASTVIGPDQVGACSDVAAAAVLVFAVPLAVALDRIGVLLRWRRRCRGRRLVLRLWVLAAAVTVVDAAVVLLTPLYIESPAATAIHPRRSFQPALMACWPRRAARVEPHQPGGGRAVRPQHARSSAISGCPRWWRARWGSSYGRAPCSRRCTHQCTNPSMARRCVVASRGGVRAGRVHLGDAVGVPAWAVAGVALVACLLIVGEAPWRTVPASVVPFDAAVAVRLAVLVVAAVPHLGLRTVLGGRCRQPNLRVRRDGSDLTNNLPTVLAGVGAMRRGRVAAAGGQPGAGVEVTGSLSGLLWQQTAARLDVVVPSRRYSAVGVRVGLPALAAAAMWAVFIG